MEKAVRSPLLFIKEKNQKKNKIYVFYVTPKKFNCQKEVSVSLL